MKLLKRISVLIAIFALVAVSGCGSKTTYDVPELLEPAGMEMDNVIVSKGEIFNSITCEGLVLPQVHALSFEASGILKEVYVSIGSEVKAGDVIARLDADLYESALASAKSGLEYSTQVWTLSEKMAAAQIDIAGLELEELKNSGASAAEIGLKEITIAELENKLAADRATWELDRAAAEKDIAYYEQQVASSVLTAPCNGTVVSSAAIEGGYVTSGIEMFTLAEDGELYISTDYVSADQVGDAFSVRGTVEGNEISVEYDAMDRDEYISRNGSGKDMKSTFRITDAGDVDVESGMRAIIFVVTEYKADALIVPACAVRLDGSGHFVYVVDENGSQVRRGIKRGIYNDAYVEITEGLSEGDVIYAGN